MKIKLLSVLFLLILLPSCVSVSVGNFNNQFENYQPKNFKYIKTVYGVGLEQYILGVGGNYKGFGAVAEAVDQMKLSNPLSDNQMYVNITTDKKRTMFIIPLFYMQNKYVVTADIIEFISEED